MRAWYCRIFRSSDSLLHRWTGWYRRSCGWRLIGSRFLQRQCSMWRRLIVFVMQPIAWWLWAYGVRRAIQEYRPGPLPSSSCNACMFGLFPEYSGVVGVNCSCGVPLRKFWGEVDISYCSVVLSDPAGMMLSGCFNWTFNCEHSDLHVCFWAFWLFNAFCVFYSYSVLFGFCS